MEITKLDALVESPQDLRDYIFGAPGPDNTVREFNWNLGQIPMIKDLRSNTGTIEHQLQYGSCVGNAICSAAEYALDKSGSFKDLSRLFVYYNARRKLADAQSKTDISDSGTSIHFALAECTQTGIAAESIWAYTQPVNQTPNTEAYADGLANRVRRYERLGAGKDLLADILVAVANNIPVVFGIHLLRKFQSLVGKIDTHVTTYNPVSIQTSSPDYIGAHAMVIVGYNRSRREFIVENSWGAAWGERGYCALSFDNITTNGFDFFAIREFGVIKTEINQQHRDDYTGELSPVVDDIIVNPVVPPVNKSSNHMATIGLIIMTVMYFVLNR